MKNIKMKINTNRKPISSQEIGKMQNFGSVMSGFEAATLPFYKKWWFVGGSGLAVIATIIIAVSAFNYNEPETTQAKNPVETTPVAEASEEQQAFIKPAFKGFDVDYTSFIVNSGKAKKYTMLSGSIISIPACHLLDEEGNAIQGEVEIRYREMNDPVDFAVSGIPMTYDSARQKYVFESAGMFELQGVKNGKPVFINPECPITIEQKTVSTEGKYNMYYLDTEKRNWEFVGKPNWVKEDAVENEGAESASLNSIFSDTDAYISYPVPNVKEDKVVKALTKELESVIKEIEDIETQAPKPPVKMDDTKQNFTIEFDEKHFPELVPFTDITFGVVDAKNFTPALYKYKWANVELKHNPISQGGNGGDSVVIEEGYTISLAREVYIGNEIAQLNKKTVTTDGKKYGWWTRTWRSIMSFFGKKYPEFEAEEITITEEVLANTRIKLDESFRMIPVDSSQYYYQRSDFRSPVKFTVYPVLSDEQYATALANFENKLKDHQKLLEKKRWQEKELRESIKKREELLRKQAQERARQMQRERNQRFANLGIDSAYRANADITAHSNNVKITNAFAASKFGIYNCDYPLQFTKHANTTITFKNGKGENQYVSNGFIIVKNKNALMNTYYNNCCDISMNHVQENTNIFFTVLPDDRVAYYPANKFKQLPDGESAHMVLQYSPKKMENINEVKAFLGITKDTGLQ